MFNPIFLEESSITDFTGKKIIIGRESAQKYGLDLGEHIDLEINGRRHRFVVSAIASPKGLFRPEGNTITALIPKETLASIYENRGKVNTLYIKTKDNSNIEKTIKELSDIYKRYTVRRTLTRSEMQEFTKSITTTFMLMLVLVVFISIFIIYTSFKVITMERLPLIGTFRSIGATKLATDILLLGESLIYGVIGGLLGCGIGFVLLYIMTKVMSSNPLSDIKTDVQMVYSLWHIIGAFSGAVILSFISSIIPIIKVSKIPVRDIVLNNMQRKSKKSNKRTMIGTLMVIVSLAIPTVLPVKKTMIMNSISVLLVGVGIVLLIPFLTKSFIFLVERLYIFVFGNEGIIAAKNLRNNKNTQNNIALLTIGIASLLMINTVSNSVAVEVVNVYGDAEYEIVFVYPEADRNIEQRIRSIDGVTDTYSNYEAKAVKIVGEDDSIRSIYGIDSHKYFEYWDFEIVGDKERILNELDKDRNIIISSILKEKYNVKEGDFLTFEGERGSISYKVIGFVNTIMRTGSVAFASDRYLKKDMKLQYPEDIYIKTSKNPSEVTKELKKKFNREDISIITMAELEEMEAKGNEQVFMLLKGFSLITMIIGIFGIFNNYVVSMISRKRTFAIYRSIGMSKIQSLKMLFIEALTGGVIGGIVGCIGGLLFIILVEYVLQSINLPVPMHFSYSLFLKAFFSGVAISVIASLSPSIKSSKVNIIDAVKYE